MPCSSAWRRAPARSSAATSNAASGAASGGATTTGPWRRAELLARSASRPPQNSSPAPAPQPASMCSGGGAHAPAKRNSSRTESQGAVSGRYVSCRHASLLAKHRVLQRLREAELHDALGRDLDRLARLRIAAHPGLAIGEHETTEIRDHEDVLRLLGRQGRELVHHVGDLLLR